MTITPGKSIPRNLMMEQPFQVYFLTEIGGSLKFSVGITQTFRTHRENQNNMTIQPTIVHYNQATGWVHSDW